VLTSLQVEVAGLVNDIVTGTTINADDCEVRVNGQLAVVSLVATEGEPDVRESLFDAVRGGSLIVDLRAEGDSADLERMTREILETALDARPGLTWRVEHLEHFQPAPPKPTERIANPQQELVS